MIVSYERRLIFIKTRKTAGTSLEIALSAQCGPRDIITPISPDDEAIRATITPIRPQNYVTGWKQMRGRDLRSLILRGRRPEFRNHMPAREVLRWIGADTWQSLYSFAFERNPWDKAVSLFYYATRENADRFTFPAFLRWLPIDVLSNDGLYTDEEGSLLVDEVFTYEHLQDGITQVTRNGGLEPLALPHAKVGNRPQRARDFRTMYSDEDAAFVAGVCATEISRFGYAFDRVEPTIPVVSSSR
jgi:hypothetical protein